MVGAHILSGVVIDPIGLDRLIPDWREDPERPLKTEVVADRFILLGPSGGDQAAELADAAADEQSRQFRRLARRASTRWLGARAEALGVEIYPGFAATELLYGEKGEVVGVATGDMGIGRDGKPKASFTRGMELRGKYVLHRRGRARLADQSRSSRASSSTQGRDPQKYGIGLKEIWQVDAGQIHARAGAAQLRLAARHADRAAARSSIITTSGLVSVGFVVHLNYANPTLSPFDEFQRFKTHPLIRETFEGGKRLAYGARAISSGGWQSVPKLAFPGGALIGCAAGFVNFARIKGSHNAILSGMLAAEKAARGARRADGANDELTAYEDAWRGSDIGRDLYKVRNVKPLWAKLGLALGVACAGFDMWTNELFGFSIFGTLKHGKPDSATLKPLAEVKPIVYPKPDGKISFDKPSSVFLSNTNHEEDQPVHLRLRDPAVADPRQPAALRRAGAALLSRRASMRWSTPTKPGAPIRASSSTRRTASTAKPATSRTPRRTSTGRRPRAAAVPIIPICNSSGSSFAPTARKRHFCLRAFFL